MEAGPGLRSCQEVDGWLDQHRESFETALRCLLRMRDFLNATKGLPHAEERLKGASRSTHSLPAAHLSLRQSISLHPPSPGRRDLSVTVVVVSRALLAEIEAYRKRMGWGFTWASSYGSDFNYDYHVSFTPEERGLLQLSND
jgi:hypothetical protein